jgi:hypothetical protein
MSKITACTLLNELNDTEIEEFIIGTEWDDLKIKALIVRRDNTVLMGEVRLLIFCLFK